MALVYYKGIGSTAATQFAVAYSPTGDRLCVAGNNAHIYQFVPANAYATSSIEITSAMTGGTHLKTPIVSLRFRPKEANPALLNMLTSVCCDGDVSHWHLGSSKRVAGFCEAGVDTFCTDFSPSGALLATVGKDHVVRLYDADTNKKTAELVEGAYGGAGPTTVHSNRLQSVAFADEHLLCSGGWDTTVGLWDPRQPRGVGAIFGPYICGDGLSAGPPNMLVTASARDDKQVELWDLRHTGAAVSAATVALAEGKPTAHLYCAAWSPSKDTIAVGGTSGVAAFAVKSGVLEPLPIQGVPADTKATCTFAVAWHPGGREICCAGDSIFLLERR